MAGIRSKAMAAVTISLSKDLLAAIDERASSMHMDRSTYLRQLALKELQGNSGGGISVKSSAGSVINHNSPGAKTVFKKISNSNDQPDVPKKRKKKQQ